MLHILVPAWATLLGMSRQVEADIQMTRTEQVINLLLSGKADDVIANTVGVHLAYVRTVRRRYEIDTVPAPTPKQLKKALESIIGAKTLDDARRIAREVLRK
jgi:transposase